MGRAGGRRKARVADATRDTYLKIAKPIRGDLAGDLFAIYSSMSPTPPLPATPVLAPEPMHAPVEACALARAHLIKVSATHETAGSALT